jgi:hypothetical protein
MHPAAGVVPRLQHAHGQPRGAPEQRRGGGHARGAGAHHDDVDAVVDGAGRRQLQQQQQPQQPQHLLFSSGWSLFKAITTYKL